MGHHHHHHHGDQSQSLSHQSEHHQGARKGRSTDLLIDFSEAVDDAETGLKCVIEEEKLKTLEKASLLTCTHSMVNVCHYSYVTQFRPIREEQCEAYYDKTCRIMFNKQATNETIRHCYRPMERQCGEGSPQMDTTGDHTICKDKAQNQPGNHHSRHLFHLQIIKTLKEEMENRLI